MSLERQDFPEQPADHSLGDDGERVGSPVNYEPIAEDQADCCPYCRRPLEILFVKFRIGGTAIIASCANCGIAQADEWRAAKLKTLDKAKTLARNAWSLWQGSTSMVSFNRRFRYVPAFLLGALNHRSCTSARRSCLWRDLSRRDSRGCANGYSRRCARDNLLQTKTSTLSA